MIRTFWEITQDSKIEIPEIQRDYAQGRMDERVEAIRQSFVSDLLDAAGLGQKINLDFIFGQSVDKTNQANFQKSKNNLEQMLVVLKKYSKETGVSFKSEVGPKPIDSSNDKVLIPFDGQQRLTTLFLLHVFIGAKAEADISSLKRFVYKTRDSSTLFTKKLVESSSLINSFCPTQSIDRKSRENISISACLKNQHWFFRSWEKDPTVSGMLVMLDEIEKQTIEKNINANEIWFNLVEKKRIEFDYFDIHEEGFDEDLYVKMNARGKGLTDFENFRAWLEKKFKYTLDEPKHKLNIYDWINKLDKQWLDVFWKSKTKIKDVDDNFLALFKNMALLYKLSQSEGKSDKKYSKERELIKLLKPNRFTPTKKYEQENVFTEDSLDFIFKILDTLTADKKGDLDIIINEIWSEAFKYKSEKSFTKLLLTEFDTLNLFHKTFFFAVLRFLFVHKKTINEYTKDDWTQLRNWLRVSKNIIYNSRIDDPTTYVAAIIALSNLPNSFILNIYSELNKIVIEDDKKNWVTFFNREQQKEECEKIAFLSQSQSSNKWHELIKRAEDHFYFYGQVGFIFKLANNDIIKFEEYLNKLEKLFSKENIGSKEFILQCAFFAFDDSDKWLKEDTSNRYKFYLSSTGNSRERDENWRIVFNDDIKRGVLKNILDQNACDNFAIQSLIGTKKSQLSNDDWKYLILDKPSMLKHCGNAMFARKSDKHFRLLEKTLNSSRQRELWSYHFYLQQKSKDYFQYSPFKSFWYYTGERGNIEPCIVYSTWLYKEVDYAMDCFYKDGFVLYFYRQNEGEIDAYIEEELINEHSFIKENKLKLPVFEYKDLNTRIAEVLKTLNEINNANQ